MEMFIPAKEKPIWSSLNISDIKWIWFLKRLNIGFPCNVSYVEFNERYEQYRKYIDWDVAIKFYNNYEAYKCIIKWNISHEIIEPVIFKDKEKEVVFNAVNYIRYLIINTIWFNENYSDTKQTEVWLLLMWDVTDIFTAKWERWEIFLEEMHKCTKDNTFMFNNYVDYIKYINRANIKWSVVYRDTVIDIMKTLVENEPEFKKVFEDVKYERKVEKTNILNYIIYCSIFLWKDLYLIYYNTWDRDDSNVWIADKRRLWNHLKRWSYVLDISEIIVSFYNSALCETFEWTDFLEIVKKKKKTEQEWEKLFYDMLEDSKSKNKITFNVESKDESPIFMSSKWIEQDLSKYKLIENELGDNWEIIKKRSKWKWNALWVVKRRTYGCKWLDDKKK